MASYILYKDGIELSKLANSYSKLVIIYAKLTFSYAKLPLSYSKLTVSYAKLTLSYSKLVKKAIFEQQRRLWTPQSYLAMFFDFSQCFSISRSAVSSLAVPFSETRSVFWRLARTTIWHFRAIVRCKQSWKTILKTFYIH